MTNLLDPQEDGATPLTEEEKEDLIPSYISVREELNEAEQTNILEAEEWATLKKRDVLSEQFLDNLHKRMFQRVWRWAGKHRRSNKNIGVDAYKIPVELRQLIDDCRFWIENETYSIDEIATRFHHGLVWIHAYPNGNGRHSRLATDLLLFALGQERFSWGRENLNDPKETRQTYIQALHASDNHDFEPLIEFVRS